MISNYKSNLIVMSTICSILRHNTENYELKSIKYRDHKAVRELEFVK